MSTLVLLPRQLILKSLAYGIIIPLPTPALGLSIIIWDYFAVSGLPSLAVLRT